jgi:hypothetical protein
MFVARIGKLLLEGNVVKTHGRMSTNNAEGTRLNMNAHKTSGEKQKVSVG